MYSVINLSSGGSRINKSVPNRPFSELIGGSTVRAAVAEYLRQNRVCQGGYRDRTSAVVPTDLDVAQEALDEVFISRQPGVQRLMSLAIDVGLSRDALMRGE
jgi:hypothetical protein